MSALRRKDVKTLAEITVMAERGPLVAKLAASVSSKQERKSARGNRFAFVQCSDPTGLFEVTVFSDTLEAARDLFEAGQNVVLTVEATLEGETLKLLARGAVAIDSVAASAGASDLRIHLNRAEAAISIATLLAQVKGTNRAQITLCVPDDTGQEIDLLLPNPYPITPQIRGAIKAMQGVVMVEEL
jgi:DNA polymerase III subunit alpha